MSMERDIVMDGQAMRELMERLWPLPRSITGNAMRASLDILAEYMPLERTEVPTGTRCFDWAVPNEWNIKDAWVKNSHGTKLVDFSRSNLSVVSYSTPVHTWVTRDELLQHLHTDPQRPAAIPYRTTYYKENWGFCVPHDQLGAFDDDSYEVCIDATLEPGSLTLAEAVIPGQTTDEILLTSYLCHPSMANNELSGPVALAAVYEALSRMPAPRHTVRFVLHPETIGAICYLQLHHKRLAHVVQAGLCVSMVGNDAPLIYKQSRRKDSIGDRVACNLFPRQYDGCDVRGFSPIGGTDQRQYCSIGIDLPMGFFGRAMGGSYPEYHCSLDTMENLSFKRMEESVSRILEFIESVGFNERYISTMPFCEPQLGKRGLYANTGGGKADNFNEQIKMLLGYGDGRHDFVFVAEQMDEPVLSLQKAVNALARENLIEKVE